MHQKKHTPAHDDTHTGVCIRMQVPPEGSISVDGLLCDAFAAAQAPRGGGEGEEEVGGGGAADAEEAGRLVQPPAMRVRPCCQQQVLYDAHTVGTSRVCVCVCARARARARAKFFSLICV
jgi:hypothetical protein